MTLTERPIREIIDNEAQTALGYFLKASFDRPASVTAQAAFVAKIIKETGENPYLLKNSLLEDSTRMDQIIFTAEAAHKNNPRAPKPTMKKVREIVEGVFTDAATLRFLSIPQLDHLSGPLYEYYATQRPHIFPEDYMKEAMNRMLRGKLVIIQGLSVNPSPAFTIYQTTEL